ncbi:MAG TPA: polysaccharide biosynthesis/export family protein [Bryobacteraceae bacterium]|nr:polysaccharide biosynthesis/export family protein [Bryobacteraceae bacterium]
MKPPLRTVAFLLCATACCAAQSGEPIQKTLPAPVKPAEAPDASGIKPGCEAEKPSPEAPTPNPYVIGALDVLDIRVWNSPNLSGIFAIGSDGLLSMPLLGQLKADGETVDSLTRLVRNRLGASVFECPPEVNIQVLRNNSKKYYIYGGVLRQGEFPLNGPMTVMDAFANCGGFKDFANLKKIYVLRGNQKLNFNYKEVSQGKNPAQNITLRNGDRIFVPE